MKTSASSSNASSTALSSELLDIEVDSLLVTVERGEDRSVLLGRRIACIAHQVAGRVAFAILDLDDLGAQIGEANRRKRPKHDGRHVDHLDALERPRRFPVPFSFGQAAMRCSPLSLHISLADLIVRLRDNWKVVYGVILMQMRQ